LATVFSTLWLPGSDNLAKEPPMPQISAFPSIKALSIIDEPTLDNAAVLVHHRRARALNGHLRGEVVEGEVLVYGVAADADDPVYGSDALAALSQLPYGYDLGHADHSPF